jgi:hypothetical protein
MYTYVGGGGRDAESPSGARQKSLGKRQKSLGKRQKSLGKRARGAGGQVGEGDSQT